MRVCMHVCVRAHLYMRTYNARSRYTEMLMHAISTDNSAFCQLIWKSKTGIQARMNIRVGVSVKRQRWNAIMRYASGALHAGFPPQQPGCHQIQNLDGIWCMHPPRKK